MADQTLSHYRLLEQLGSGGMGVVYKAIDTRLNRTVALKLLPPDLTRDADANLRFRQEAQAASALDHPNICTVHEIDETPEGQTFLAMAYYEGETLKQRIARGPLPVPNAIDIATQVAQGLSKAHAAGIVHRDIKPANLIVTADGILKILDFGIAKAPGQQELTRTGTTVGTLAYMSPEQLSGAGVDHRVDIWALGAVLYEMLTGQPPFGRDDSLALVSKILNDEPPALSHAREAVSVELERIVVRALNKRRDERYASASELQHDLAACRIAASAPRVQATEIPRIRRKTVVILASAAVVLGAAGIWAWTEGRAERRAREELIPEAARLASQDLYVEAFALAEEAERQVPTDPTLTALWSTISANATIQTAPSDADVFFRDYLAPDGAWTFVGKTPLVGVRLPQGFLQWKIEKAGFEPLMLAAANPSPLFANFWVAGTSGGSVDLSLLEKGVAPPGMIHVPRSSAPVFLDDFGIDRVSLEPFFVDRHETTNREFKDFVDAGGYSTERYWTGLRFVKDGRELSWKDAVAQFVDSTGRPGPSTWELSDYPAGQDDYPVGGVSWYEAAAYASFRGKTLPTIYHWARAGTSLAATPAMVRLSNFSGKRPAPVGSYRGMGPYGTFDTAGNVREWVWNASEDNRWILGGAWNEPTYSTTQRRSLPPFDRSAVNGFRCVTYTGDAPVAEALTAPRVITVVDHRTRKPVSDELFEVLAKQFAYDPGPLNERIEWASDTHRDYVRQRISFEAGYDGERTPLHLLLPKNAQPPYRVVVFYPGSGAFMNPGPSDERLMVFAGPEEFVVKSGLALAFPIYEGTYERWRATPSLAGAELIRRERLGAAHRRQDIGRTLDYLQTREDILSDRVVYLGFSRGAAALIHVALEGRFKAAILVSGGVANTPPELYPLNYAPRITIPVLMVNGRYDHVFPYETSQKPLFDNLGTPPADKAHLTFDAGHYPLPRGEWIPKAIAWIDKYAPPGPASAR